MQLCRGQACTFLALASRSENWHDQPDNMMVEDGAGRRTHRYPEEKNSEAELGKGMGLEMLEDYMAGLKDEADG